VTRAHVPRHTACAAENPVHVASIRDPLSRPSSPAWPNRVLLLAHTAEKLSFNARGSRWQVMLLTGISMHAASDLMVAKAGVAGIASPYPRLHPHIRALAADGRPLIIPGATRSAPTERSNTATVGAVDRKRADVFRALCNAEVDGAAPAHVCARLSRFDPVSREDSGKCRRRIVCAVRTAQNPALPAVRPVNCPPRRIAWPGRHCVSAHC
jgi:hypothetical protein